jgi:hypothetical protein
MCMQLRTPLSGKWYEVISLICNLTRLSFQQLRVALQKTSLVCGILTLLLFLPDEVNQSIIIRSVDFD